MSAEAEAGQLAEMAVSVALTVVVTLFLGWYVKRTFDSVIANNNSGSGRPGSGIGKSSGEGLQESLSGEMRTVEQTKEPSSQQPTPLLSPALVAGEL